MSPSLIFGRVGGLEGDEVDVCNKRLHADAVMTLAGKKDEADEVVRAPTSATILVVKPPRDLPIG